jgi:hypothetical protein
MNYANTKEIQEVFNINITEKNRTIPYVAIRCFYAEMRVEQLTGNISSRYTTIAKETGCNRDNLYNMLLKAKLFKEDKYTKILFEAFKNKDKTLIEAYKEQIKQINLDNHRNRYIQKVFNEFQEVKRVKVVTKLDKNKAPMTNLKLAEYLRTNKVFKHELWDTPVKNISENQWKQVKQINPKMFDNFCK